jgi:His-Xaa-Ser system radical SAM maturase HxsC
MLRLGGTGLELRNFDDDTPRVLFRISEAANRPVALRESEAFLIRDRTIPEGFAAYLAFASGRDALGELSSSARTAVLPDEYKYLSDGDIVRLQPQARAIRVLYRKRSPHNTFLTTERCNHYCLMCSQPPRDVDDSWLVDEILQTLPLIDTDTGEIGFTGGEPTLLGGDLIRILATASNYLPRTSLHILSNGRRFADDTFTQAYAAIQHHDMMVGIPLYSDISTLHDYVVQADGAFDETIRGILNLKRHRQKVEIRVVLHKQTYRRLPRLAEFLVRNLAFVDHVALMGLEMTGFTKPNLADLWIDPVDYKDELYAAATLLRDSRMHVSVYNHQLCLLDKRLWPLARKSISDWKNEYMPECDGCSEMTRCGGFFSSAKLRYSDHIRPFTAKLPEAQV